MFSRIRGYFRKKFGFSETEIHGLFVLTPIVAIAVFIPTLVKNTWSTDSADQARDEALLEQWFEDSQENEHIVDKPKIKEVPYFDPNYMTAKQWENLGFDTRVAERITNYRSKGGRFQTKEDLLKIYGIDEKLALAYFPSMVIAKKNKLFPKSKPKYSKKKVDKHKPELVKVYLNSADTAQFKTIKGIGSYWAGRIVKYRESLGGFVSPQQLGELYGIDQDLADWVIRHSEFDASTPRQISVNQDSISVLSRHPYISYKIAKHIVAYRKQYGDYTSVEDLSQIVTISDSLLQKISPYLTVSK